MERFRTAASCRLPDGIPRPYSTCSQHEGNENRAISPFKLSPTMCLQMWRILSSPARETPDVLSHLDKERE
ncbi:hypothetical protein EMCRGX_G024890 [Ephydatia muelleri]